MSIFDFSFFGKFFKRGRLKRGGVLLMVWERYGLAFLQNPLICEGGTTEAIHNSSSFAPQICRSFLLATNDTDLHESFFTQMGEVFYLADHCHTCISGFFLLDLEYSTWLQLSECKHIRVANADEMGSAEIGVYFTLLILNTTDTVAV